MAQTEFKVNGRPIKAEDVDPKATLLTYLRDVLRLTGPKNGCGQGHCGACTVIVDGKAQRACLLRMGKMAGKSVTTIEGLATPDTLHALQYAFLTEGAVQCGFCTPGMILAAKVLLDQNLSPSDDDIRKALTHNLCRCTGYVSIVRAIREAARLLRSGQEYLPRAGLLPTADVVVGESVVRIEGIDKVTGATKFADDLYAPEMLYAATLRSEYPHARVLSIDVEAARQVSGVAAVLTAKDVPGRNRFGLIRADQPVLAEDRVRFVGDAVAVVYAETLAAAQEALEEIAVEYEELEVVSTPQRAMEPDAPRLHEEGNVLEHWRIRKGDVEEGFAQADVIVEGTYYTPFVEHAYMESEACLAVPGPDGGVTIWVGSQGPFVDRNQIIASLALEPEKVRVVNTPLGGGFGGKEDITVQILAALGVLHTGRPVKMVLSRPESIRVSTKRHAEYMHYRTGATADGKLVAAEVKIIGDTGAYASVGESVLFRSAAFSCGPYVVPNVSIDSYAVYTNNPPCGAMRGYGSPQAAFASESQMDILARRLNMDPFEIRLKNALDVDETTITGHKLTSSIGVKETLIRVREALAASLLPTPAPGKHLGVGVATAYKNVGLGPGLDDRAGAIVELDPEGQMVVRSGCIDMGQGLKTIVAQIVAETLSVPYRDITVITGDTGTCPDSFMTTASRATLLQGNAVMQAATKLREAILDYVGQEFNVQRSRLRLGKGEVSWKSDPDGTETFVSLQELGRRAAQQGHHLAFEEYYTAPRSYRGLLIADSSYEEPPDEFRLHVAYCFGTDAVIVEVDEDTGEVQVLKIIAAHDVGKAINPRGINGQIEGGVVMGLGYALSEEFVVKDGRVLTDTLRKCGVPRISQMPEIIPLIVENPHPLGPFEAKGMAELPISVTAPAIANAIYDAVGVRMTQLPMTPEKILAALQQK